MSEEIPYYTIGTDDLITRHCPHCGTKIVANYKDHAEMKFCSNCGTKILRETASNKKDLLLG